MRWCLQTAGICARDLDAVAYSYDPTVAASPADVVTDAWDGLRTRYVERAPRLVMTEMPGCATAPSDSCRTTWHMLHPPSSPVRSTTLPCRCTMGAASATRTSPAGAWTA